ncbi:alpha/beta hydrolase [Elizabethkingia sp. JS20170427COW]|uniref:alpha/beta hydrolase n=1 Tax=Elizabethkingia sp. JS20170427COW TaxID=2583851 RepID=UPI0021054438|nr:alpha/beta hydrolase-fold protein [Elizabethkingia sp. JS20170427COW]
MKKWETNLYICFMKLHYLLRKPYTIDENTRLLVMLHGYGSNEEDLFSFVPSLPENWLVVSFRAPILSSYGGYAWYNINFTDVDQFIDMEQAEEALKEITSNIQDIQQEYGISGKTHLMGFSQGGILSYALALRNPENYQKIAILSAYPELKILQNLSRNTKALQELDFFISHGMEDGVIPLDLARTAAELLEDLGIHFSFREYMSGHSVNQKNYIDLMSFLER